VFDLNRLSFDLMYKSYVSNIVKYARTDEEVENSLEILSQTPLTFSSSAVEF